MPFFDSWVRLRNHLPAGDEDLGLIGQVGAARLDQIDQGEAVLHCYVLGAQRLGQRVAVRRPRLAGRIVGGDHALDAGDDPDPGDDVGAQRLVRAPRRQSGQLEKWRVPIEQQFDPLPGQQLAPRTVTGHVLLAPAGARLRQQLLELLEALQHPVPVGDEHVVAPINPGGQQPHPYEPIASCDDRQPRVGVVVGPRRARGPCVEGSAPTERAALPARGSCVEGSAPTERAALPAWFGASRAPHQPSGLRFQPAVRASRAPHQPSGLRFQPAVARRGLRTNRAG